MPDVIANPTEDDIGKPCPHGDTYGSCPSSMCYVWTWEDITEGMTDEEIAKLKEEKK